MSDSKKEKKSELNENEALIKNLLAAGIPLEDIHANFLSIQTGSAKPKAGDEKTGPSPAIKQPRTQPINWSSETAAEKEAREALEMAAAIAAVRDFEELERKQEAEIEKQLIPDPRCFEDDGYTDFERGYHHPPRSGIEEKKSHSVTTTSTPILTGSSSSSSSSSSLPLSSVTVAPYSAFLSNGSNIQTTNGPVGPNTQQPTEKVRYEGPDR